MVGYAMSAVTDDEVPWHRVINAKGEVSPRSHGDGSVCQRLLLEDEGVIFDERGRVDLARICW